jgi:acetylornithine deacetylase/succinyl-diaminopimelate desuccinylase-like protein
MAHPTPEHLEEVKQHIDQRELTELCLEIGGTESPYGHEGDAGQYLFDWLRRNSFNPRKVGLNTDRFNVVATLPGAHGRSLAFNSHLDTGRSRSDEWILRNPNLEWYHSAWVQDDVIVGDGVINDKGPLACFLLAARAIRDSGLELGGDVFLTGVCGEIGQEPVDEFQGVQYSSKDIGARYLATHGPALPDRVIVAEATSFALVGLEAGKLHVKVTSHGHETYTPYLDEDRYNENAITRMTGVLEAVKRWAANYERENVLETPVGVCRPKVNIGAIRGGAPYRMTHTPEVCSSYIDIRLTPEASPAEVLRSFSAAVRTIPDVDIEPYLYRPGHIVPEGSDLVTGCRWAHELVHGDELRMGDGPVASMWRDINVFNEIGIPAITYGPPRAHVDGMPGIRVADTYATTLFYAAAALALCGVQ